MQKSDTNSTKLCNHKTPIYYVIMGYDVVIVGPVTRRVAAKLDMCAVILKRVVKCVEDLRRHQVAWHEHIRPLECIRPQHFHQQALSPTHSSSQAQMIITHRPVFLPLKKFGGGNRKIFINRDRECKLGLWNEFAERGRVNRRQRYVKCEGSMKTRESEFRLQILRDGVMQLVPCRKIFK